MQSKHCALMRGYCRQQNIEARREDGTQVRHAQGATAQSVLGVGGFYRHCAQTAAAVAKDHMVARWSRPQQPGAQVFTAGLRVDAGVQMQVQPDGYQYEVSYWYDGADIYVLFHCYPSR